MGIAARAGTGLGRPQPYVASGICSDNGIPFPSGKTNLYTQQGMGEPLIIKMPSGVPRR